MLYQVSKEEGSKPTSGYFREKLQCYVHTLHSKSLTVTPSVWCKITPFRNNEEVARPESFFLSPGH